MDIRKCRLVPVPGGRGEADPEVLVLLPAQTECPCVTGSDTPEALRGERSDHVRHGGNHAERQARDTPIELYGMPGEDEKLAREVGADVRRPGGGSRMLRHEIIR